MIDIQFYTMEKMLIILFSYKFGDNKSEEKAQNLDPEYGKIAC